MGVPPKNCMKIKAPFSKCSIYIDIYRFCFFLLYPTVAHICKHNKQVLKHNTIFLNATHNYRNTTQYYPNTTQNCRNTTQYYPNTTQYYPDTTQNYRNTTQNYRNTIINAKLICYYTTYNPIISQPLTRYAPN